MKATRHNGRAGIHGVYDAKHNDRQFNIENSEHIDTKRAAQNLYWDCYQGYCLPENPTDRQFTFSEVEKTYYYEHYSEYTHAQNKRNEAARHPERNRNTNDLLTNNKTCPEETIYQLGNIDDTVPPAMLAKIATEFFDEFEKRYGSHIHIIDWALHLDEATPHIHERHVFDARNQYRELCPQQEKALKELGFQLPEPTQKKSKKNNRKLLFDAECRNLFLQICQENGVEIDTEPIYGGQKYLEKQDYIIENQKRRIAIKEQALKEITLRLEAEETFVNEVAEIAYNKACDAVTEIVKTKTVQHDLKVIDDYGKWVIEKDSKLSDNSKNIAVKVVNAIKATIEKASLDLLGHLVKFLQEPEQKKKGIGQVRVSVAGRLQKAKEQVAEQKIDKIISPKKAR